MANIFIKLLVNEEKPKLAAVIGSPAADDLPIIEWFVCKRPYATSARLKKLLAEQVSIYPKAPQRVAIGFWFLARPDGKGGWSAVPINSRGQTALSRILNLHIKSPVEGWLAAEENKE